CLEGLRRYSWRASFERANRKRFAMKRPRKKESYWDHLFASSGSKPLRLLLRGSAAYFRELREESLRGTAVIPSLAITGLLFRSSYGTPFRNFESRNRFNDLVRRHNRIGVAWKISDERGMHILIRVVSGRVFYHRHFIAKLSGKANR